MVAGDAEIDTMVTTDAATYGNGSPSWLCKCKRIYMDVGSNIEVQVRKFYEREESTKTFQSSSCLTSNSAMRKNDAGLGSRLSCVSWVCNPCPQLRPRLQKLEETYSKRGRLVHIYPSAAFVEEKDMEFERHDGVGSGAAICQRTMAKLVCEPLAFVIEATEAAFGRLRNCTVQ